MTRKITAAAAAIVAASVLGLGTPAALAAPAPARRASVAPVGLPAAGPDQVLIAGLVRGLLRYNPGARQISPNAVRYKGAILGVSVLGPSRSIRPDSESGVCPNNYVCLFQNINFNFNTGHFVGAWIDFYRCGVNYNLFNYVLPSGGNTWANQASSIDYPGSANGHEAKFNHNGNWWLYLYRDHYLRNLTLNGGPNPQHNSNDWITGLYAC